MHMAIAHFTMKGLHENILAFDVLNGQTWHMVMGSACSFGSDRKRESAPWLLRTAPAAPDIKITNILKHPISIVAWNRISEITAGVEKRQSSSEPPPISSPVWPVWSPRWLSNWQFSPINSCCTKPCKLNIYLASSCTPLDGHGSVQKVIFSMDPMKV